MIAALQPASCAPRDLIVCFSHLRWNFVLQRPQHLMMRAALHSTVVYVEEPIFEAVTAVGLRIQRHGQVTVVTPVLEHGETEPERVIKSQIRTFLQRFAGARTVVWCYTPMALPLATAVQYDCLVYDCMDELSAFMHAPPQLQALERDLLRQADLVFTGGASLHRAKQKTCADALCFPSSVDTAHFARARDGDRSDPADQAGIPYPRIGFFGVVDERLDIELVRGLAERKPDWQFVMIGPVVKIDPDTLPDAPNIHWLGRKNYSELPDYLAGWTAGFMPFALNESTRFISPTKTPEFLAAGLPVVSTPIRDVVDGYGAAGLIEIARGVDEHVAAISSVLEERDPGWLRAVDAHLALSSWDGTWAEMHALIEGVLQRASKRPDAPRILERTAHV